VIPSDYGLWFRTQLYIYPDPPVRYPSNIDRFLWFVYYNGLRLYTMTIDWTSIEKAWSAAILKPVNGEQVAVFSKETRTEAIEEAFKFITKEIEGNDNASLSHN